ncbi:unnamed protein product, partial [Cyprideis torosa]
MADWTSAFGKVADRDPNRCHWFLEYLSARPFQDEQGAFLAAARLRLVATSMEQLEWRIPLLLHRLLEAVVPHLSHPLETVRRHLAAVLVTIFMYDLPQYRTRAP